MIFLPFIEWWSVLLFCPSLNIKQLHPIFMFMGIGQVLLLFGFVIFLFFDRWCEFQLALRKEEALKYEKEMEFKKRNIQAQLDDAEKRRVHEARKQPDREIVSIIHASKLTTKKTSEVPQEINSKVIAKETSESERIDQKFFDKAIEKLNEITNANNQK
jgi:hypothetical protein